MKKFFVLAFLTVISVCAVDAQNLGLRFLYGAELSYQHPLSDNRLEFGLGLTSLSGGLNVSGTYQWVKPMVDNFNWYYGIGAGIGLWDEVAALSGLGQVGIEYNFEVIPLQLSLDWRPALTFVFYETGSTAQFWPQGVGLGIRYRF